MPRATHADRDSQDRINRLEKEVELLQERLQALQETIASLYTQVQSLFEAEDFSSPP